MERCHVSDRQIERQRRYTRGLHKYEAVMIKFPKSLLRICSIMPVFSSVVRIRLRFLDRRLSKQKQILQISQCHNKVLEWWYPVVAKHDKQAEARQTMLRSYWRSFIPLTHSSLEILAISFAFICHAKIKGTGPSIERLASPQSFSNPSGPMMLGSSVSA